TAKCLLKRGRGSEALLLQRVELSFRLFRRCRRIVSNADLAPNENLVNETIRCRFSIRCTKVQWLVIKKADDAKIAIDIAVLHNRVPHYDRNAIDNRAKRQALNYQQQAGTTASHQNACP